MSVLLFDFQHLPRVEMTADAGVSNSHLYWIDKVGIKAPAPPLLAKWETWTPRPMEVSD